MFATHTAKLWIVKNEIAELGALLHQVHLRQADDFVVERVNPDQLAKNNAGIVEAESLVEITGQKILLNHGLVLPFLPRCWDCRAGQSSGACFVAAETATCTNLEYSTAVLEPHA